MAPRKLSETRARRGFSHCYVTLTFSFALTMASLAIVNCSVHGLSGLTIIKKERVTVCKKGYGYPDHCPRAGDPRNRTRCCRHLLEASCCEERARHVCMRRFPSSAKNSADNIDPGLDVWAIYCPGPGDRDDDDKCCWRRWYMFCCSRYITPKILGGVLGSLAILTLVTLVIILVLKVKGSRYPAKPRDEPPVERAL